MATSPVDPAIPSSGEKGASLALGARSSFVAGEPIAQSPTVDALAAPAGARPAVYWHDERGTIVVPPIASLDEFRAWASSDDFPTRGRIDFVNGCIEVDMAPEDAADHSQPKTEIARVVATLAKATRFARVYIDRMLITHPGANLSAEPDVMVVTREAFKAGRIRAVPRAGDPSKSAEFEGSPDLIVEIVSDSSVGKDRGRLPALYFAAGVREFWFVDARGAEVVFQLFVRGEGDWQEVPPDAEGYRRSLVFARRFRLERTFDDEGGCDYDLHVGE